MSEWKLEEVTKNVTGAVKKRPWLFGGAVVGLGALWLFTRSKGGAYVSGYPQYPQEEAPGGEGEGGGGGGGGGRDDAALLDAFGEMLHNQSQLIAGALNQMQYYEPYPLMQEIKAYEPEYQMMDLNVSGYGPYAPGGIAVTPEVAGLDNTWVHPNYGTTHYTEYVRASIVSSPTVASSERPYVPTGRSSNPHVTAAEKAAGPGKVWNQFGELVRSGGGGGGGGGSSSSSKASTTSAPKAAAPKATTPSAPKATTPSAGGGFGASKGWNRYGERV